MISFVLFSFTRAWQGFWRNAVMSLAATATMVLMLLLLAGFWIIQTGLLAGLQFTEQKVEVVAYLQTNATDGQVTTLRERLATMPEVASVAYVSREEALARFRASMAAQGREDLTRYLGTNPLYASLEVKLVDPSQVRVVGDALRGDPSVRNVINIEDLVERVLTVTSILRTAGTVLLVIVGVIALFIIINTIRLAVLARAEEIEVMRLVGRPTPSSAGRSSSRAPSSGCSARSSRWRSWRPSPIPSARSWPISSGSCRCSSVR